MSITLADQYYLKAMDAYPYELEETVENLNYALSYNNEHAGANFLIGKVYFEQFNKFSLAEEHFILAMSVDSRNPEICAGYCELLIKVRKLKEALRLVTYAMELPGVYPPEFIHFESLIYENQGKFEKAKEKLRTAIQFCNNNGDINFLENEIKRVERKQKHLNLVNYHLG